MLREAEGIEILMMCRDIFPKNSRCVSKLGKKIPRFACCEGYFVVIEGLQPCNDVFEVI